MMWMRRCSTPRASSVSGRRPVEKCSTPIVGRRACRAGASHQDAAASTFEGEDFYSLLGLEPAAEPADIRRAYRRLMLELHPDLVTAAGGAGHAEVQRDAEVLAALLNQIHDTLMDPEARAAYDAVAGFAAGPDAVNPLMDTSFPRDQVFVDEVTCIGCGKCVRQGPLTFEIEASKYGRARVISQTAEPLDDIQVALEVCPVSCIHWVSLPQLSLLEAALATLPRVEVFILQRCGNRPVGNVFEVAYKAFERRRSAAAAAAAAAGKKGGQQAYPEAGHGDQRFARVAGLAAAAARAVRLWHAQGNGSVRRVPIAALTD